MEFSGYYFTFFCFIFFFETVFTCVFRQKLEEDVCSKIWCHEARGMSNADSICYVWIVYFMGPLYILQCGLCEMVMVYALELGSLHHWTSSLTSLILYMLHMLESSAPVHFMWQCFWNWAPVQYNIIISLWVCENPRERRHLLSMTEVQNRTFVCLTIYHTHDIIRLQSRTTRRKLPTPRRDNAFQRRCMEDLPLWCAERGAVSVWSEGAAAGLMMEPLWSAPLPSYTLALIASLLCSQRALNHVSRWKPKLSSVSTLAAVSYLLQAPSRPSRVLSRLGEEHYV